MSAPKSDLSRARENRIIDEFLVDAEGPDEWAVAWYAHLQENLRFPFEPACIATRATSPLQKGEVVEVLGLGPENDCRNQMQVVIEFGGREMAVPLAQLDPIVAYAEMREALGDWRYWLGAGYTA